MHLRLRTSDFWLTFDIKFFPKVNRIRWLCYCVRRKKELGKNILLNWFWNWLKKLDFEIGFERNIHFVVQLIKVIKSALWRLLIIHMENSVDWFYLSKCIQMKLPDIRGSHCGLPKRSRVQILYEKGIGVSDVPTTHSHTVHIFFQQKTELQVYSMLICKVL